MDPFFLFFLLDSWCDCEDKKSDDNAYYDDYAESKSTCWKMSYCECSDCRLNKEGKYIVNNLDVCHCNCSSSFRWYACPCFKGGEESLCSCWTKNRGNGCPCLKEHTKSDEPQVDVIEAYVDYIKSIFKN